MGKTTAVYEFLKSNMIDHKFENIYFCSPCLSNLVEEWEQELNSKIQYLPQLPDDEFFKTVEEHTLLIIDDYWDDACNSSLIKNAFKIYSGKKNLSIFITSQNPFESKGGRSIRNNLNYYLLFQNLGDVGINKLISRQIGFTKLYIEAQETIGRYDFVLFNRDLSSNGFDMLFTKLFSKYPYAFKK